MYYDILRSCCDKKSCTGLALACLRDEVPLKGHTIAGQKYVGKTYPMLKKKKKKVK